MKTLATVLAAAGLTGSPGPEFEMTRLEKAIHHVESGGRIGPDIYGDNGNAIGPLQIWKSCWKDAVQHDPSIGGHYEMCHDLEYSCMIFRAYMNRYAVERRLKRVPTDEDRARIWNGGPNGYKKKATDKYWNKVKERLNDSSKSLG